MPGLPRSGPRRRRLPEPRRRANGPGNAARESTDADAVYAEWEAIGIRRDEKTGSRLEPPALTDYGMREFALVDPSGNLVRVGSPPKP